MPDQKTMQTCFRCGTQFQFGPNQYDGRYIRSYDLCLCRMCYDSIEDGWPEREEPKLLAHLRAKGIPEPARNEKGWLPRE